MTKKFIAFIILAFSVLPVPAQDFNILNHYSLSAGIGTTGFTADVGTMLTDYVGIRGGIDYLHSLKYGEDLDLSYIYNGAEPLDAASISDKVKDMNLPTEVAVEGKLESFTGHALLDIYPFRKVGFHLTVGAYFASKDKFVTVYNKKEGALKMVSDFNARRGDFESVPESYGQVAAQLGGYSIMPDDKGNATAFINVKKVRPYVGLGFGRAVPKNSRMNCQFDMGVQIWDTPQVYDGVSGERLTSGDANSDAGKVLKAISKIKVYPVISVRISGRLF